MTLLLFNPIRVHIIYAIHVCDTNVNKEICRYRSGHRKETQIM